MSRIASEKHHCQRCEKELPDTEYERICSWLLCLKCADYIEKIIDVLVEDFQ